MSAAPATEKCIERAYRVRLRPNTTQASRLHAQVGNARREHLHQTSATLVANAQVICLEDLAIKAMGKSLHRSFRRGVADAGLGELRRQVTYKAAWSGRTISVVDRWYPSSKTCSACGAIKADLTLRDRTWACPSCGVSHERDSNAAVNIEREGLRRLAERP